MPIRTHGRSALRCHRRQLITHRKGAFLEILRNSVLGLVDVYNMLPVYIADAPTVKLFQRRLQELLVTCVREQVGEWWNMFSPRDELYNHKLRGWRTWIGAYPNEEVVNEEFIEPFDNLDLMNDFFLSR